MGWRGYIHSPRKTVFFWSQKAACTSLFSFLSEDIEQAQSDKKFFHTHSQPYTSCLRVLRKQGYRSVILVRHPVTRCISAYFNKFCLYRNRPLRDRADLEPFAQNLHDLYCESTGAQPQHNTMSFVQFLDTIETSYAQRINNEHPINGHWECQIPHFLFTRGLYYDEIVHVERLEKELHAVARQLNMSYNPRQMNQTNLSTDESQRLLINVPARDMSQYAFGYNNFVTDQTLERIHKIYNNDFNILGYPLSPDMDDATLRSLPKKRSNWRSWLPHLPR